MLFESKNSRSEARLETGTRHLMNRGDRREQVFLDDNDRKTFLSTLAEACEGFEQTKG